MCCKIRVYDNCALSKVQILHEHRRACINFTASQPCMHVWCNRICIVLEAYYYYYTLDVSAVIKHPRVEAKDEADGE